MSLSARMTLSIGRNGTIIEGGQYYFTISNGGRACTTYIKPGVFECLFGTHFPPGTKGRVIATEKLPLDIPILDLIEQNKCVACAKEGEG